MKICNAYLEQRILCSYADSRLSFFTAIFGFLLVTLAVTSFGAPVERRTSNHPCGHAVNTGKHGGRHGLAKMIDVVKCQLAIVITHFKDKTNNKTLNDYYVKVSFRLKWTEVSHKSKWKPVVNIEQHPCAKIEKQIASELREKLSKEMWILGRLETVSSVSIEKIYIYWSVPK
jgi:hypothetical protein